MNSQNLDLQQAENIFKLPVHCIEIEFPKKLGQVLGSTDDLKSPKELRPIFYGCFDWHSAVHGYWSIIKLLKEFPQLDASGEVKAILDRNITPENVSIESVFLPELCNPDFSLEPGKVSDRTDGHLVHLDGLNFSRASCLYAIAKKMPELAYLKTIADNHLNNSLGNITDDDYMGSHWLGSFALYALMNK